MIAELEDEIDDFPAIAEETQASSHVNLLLGRYYNIASKAEILTSEVDIKLQKEASPSSTGAPIQSSVNYTLRFCYRYNYGET